MALILPDRKDNMVGTICGIDPGTNMLGFSILQFDLDDLSVQSVYATSFKSDSLIEKDNLISLTHNERIAKIFAQKNNLVKQFLFFNPTVVTCENPFINRLRPAAYGPLMEIVFAIRTAVIEYNEYIKFLTFEPSVIKKAIGASAFAGKDEVKKFICENKELSPNMLTDFSNLDEHAIDAIAVAYTHLLKRRAECPHSSN